MSEATTGHGDIGLATALWFAAHHDRPATPEALSARLPGGTENATPHLLAQALAVTGLKTQVTHRAPTRLDPAVLPAIVFERNGKPMILNGLSKKDAQLIDPSTPDKETTVAVKTLRRFTREVMLVTPDDGQETGTQGHWFWRPMRENMGAWIQVMFAALAINVLGLALPIFVMNVYDRVIPNLAFVTMWTLAIGVAIALGLDFALRTLRAGLLERIGRRLDIRISADLFRHVLGLRPADLPGGALGTASILREFDTVREFFGSASLVAIIDLLFIGVFIAVLWLIVGPLAFVPLVAIPAMFVLAFAAQLPMGTAVKRAQAATNRRSKVMIEALTGLETIKTLGAEPAMSREWDGATIASARVSGQSRFWSNVAVNGTQTIQQAVSVAIIVWGVFLISDGRISIGALIAANILSGRALGPLGGIAQTVFRAHFASRSMRTISELLATAPERPSTISTAIDVRDGRVELNGVSFTYPGSQTPALNDLSLAITPGETVALLGRVGSGKSTLGRVISGLLAPSAGTVLIDGQNIGQYDPAELRKGIGYLPQDPELFTGTLGENLLIGAPGASSAEIDRALAIAGLDLFVAALPAGLNHPIGEAGRALSGGQRQGLALARLILRAPKVLFLDEPTNAMDRDMEQAVTARLSSLTETGTTLILCTHRPSLANLAHRMVVLDQGRKVLDGPRDQVLGALAKAQAKRDTGGAS